MESIIDSFEKTRELQHVKRFTPHPDGTFEIIRDEAVEKGMFKTD